MADGMHGFDEILVNDVEELLSSLRGFPEISLTDRGNESGIYDGTSPFVTLYIK